VLETIQPSALGLGHGHEPHHDLRHGGNLNERVDVNTDHVLGIDATHLGCDVRTGITPLHAIPLIAESPHQLGECLRDSMMRPPGSTERAGEAMSGDRRNDEMKCVGGVAAVRARIAERSDQVDELHDRARPPVDEHERCGGRLRRPHVQEVHGLPVDRGNALRIRVERRLVRAPVVLRPPILGELLQVVRRDAATPAQAGQVIGPPRGAQPPLEVVEVCVGNGDAKGRQRGLGHEPPPDTEWNILFRR
jgi:hypothetical protein